MKVIDSSSLVKYLSLEEGWEVVLKHLEEGCVIPELAMKGVANALWKKVLVEEMRLEASREVLQKLPKVVRVVGQAELLERAFEIAVQNRITVYDSLFIALAESKKAALVTSDRKQAEVAKALGIEVFEV